MINVLGLDTRIFSQVSVLEQASYKTATNAFFIVIVMSLASNAYMGMMLYSSWLAAIPFALFFGFIQFSILRIALITLLSKPLAEAQMVPEITSLDSTIKPSVWNSLKRKTSKMRLSSFFRFLFVALVAVNISFPLCSLIMFSESMNIEDSHRIELVHSNQSNKVAISEIQATHFPFHVFKELLPQNAFKFLLLISICLVFAPLYLVSKLRYNTQYEYLEKARQEMLKLVAIDYNETMEQCQYSLDKDFPSNKKTLKDLSVFVDAPINSVYKNETKHSIGNKIAFNQFIQSIE
jgi:hypothetical protein